MKLFDLFNVEPPEGVVVEFPLGSGIYHIPIEEVKKMLWGDFEWWGTENFKFKETFIGHKVLVGGSVELVVRHSELPEIKFVGAYTFEYLKDTPEQELNDNLEATILAECIKNASKNLGRKYGMFLNTKRVLNRITPEPTPEVANRAGNAIDNLLKTKNK